MLSRVAAGIACALATMMLAEPVSAQLGDVNRSLELASGQAAITQQLPKYSLLVALNVDREGNLGSLETSRVRFDQVLKGLRHGDPLLGLERPDDFELVKELDRADEIWRRLDIEIQAGLAEAEFTRERIDRIADLSTTLQDAMDAATTIIAEARRNGQFFSMLLIALEQSDRQRILVEQLTKELLLVAYGEDVEVNRALLRQSAGEFDESLAALINGDLDRLLLPAPTEAIRDELTELRRLWQADLKPIVDLAVGGNPMDDRTIRRVAEINSRLLERSTHVLALYREL